MVWFSQFISIAAIVLILVFVLRRYPLKTGIRPLASVALLTALSIALSFFSLMIPLMGVPSLKIGFSQLPLMIAGFLFGPSWGVLAGLTADLGELLLGVTGFPFFGFTLNKVLIGLIPGLIAKCVREDDGLHHLLPQIILGALTIATLSYVSLTKELLIGDVVYHLDLKTRISIILVVLVFNALLMFGLQNLKKKYKAYPFIPWLLSVLCIEVIIQLCLTPLWLNIMYQLPLVISISVRIVKSYIMIFVNSLVGYALLRIGRGTKKLK